MRGSHRFRYAAKKNPEIALGVVGLVTPGVVKKIAPIVVAAALSGNLRSDL